MRRTIAAPFSILVLFVILGVSVGIRRRKKVPKWCEFAAKAILCFMPIMLARFDNDTYWMIAVGRNLLKHGYDRIDRIDFYSFHSIAQQHTIDILYALIDHTFGRMAIVALAGAVFAFLELLVYTGMKKRVKAPAVATLAGLSLLGTYVTTRPCLISSTLLIAEYMILDDYTHRDIDRLWIIPILALVFINVHMALWPMQIAFIAAFIAEWTIKKLRKEKTFRVLPLVLLIPSIAVMSLVNPYGAEGFMYPFGLYSHDLSFIYETQPVFCAGWNAVPFFALLLLMPFTMSKSARKEMQIAPSYALSFLGAAVMCSFSLRHLAVAAVPASFLVCDCLKPFDIGKSDQFTVRAFMLSAICVCMSTVFVAASGKYDTVSPYQGAFDFLEKQNGAKSSRLYTSLNTGGYAAYRGFRGYMDPRTEPHYKSYNHQYDWSNEYLDVYYGRKAIGDLIRKYRFSYVVTDESTEYEKEWLTFSPNARRIYKEKKVEVWKIC